MVRNLEYRRGPVAAGLAVVLLGALMAIASPATALDAGSPSGSGVQPMAYSGNRTCGELVPGTTEFKVEPVSKGQYTDGQLVVKLSAVNRTFNFTVMSGGTVFAAFVKGGDGGNLYSYPSGTLGDTSLHSPVNPSNGNYYGLSHISFCYRVVVDDVITLNKVDDKGTALAGVVMQLWKDAVDTGTKVGECTTSVPDDGTCAFTITESGTYWGHEETGLTGYGTAADQSATVTRDAVKETITLTFVNPRLFTKIVLVCQGNALYASDVTEGSVTKSSLDGLTPAQEAALCATGGARFEDNPAGTHQLDVVIN